MGDHGARAGDGEITVILNSSANIPEKIEGLTDGRIQFTDRNGNQTIQRVFGMVTPNKTPVAIVENFYVVVHPLGHSLDVYSLATRRRVTHLPIQAGSANKVHLQISALRYNTDGRADILVGAERANKMMLTVSRLDLTTGQAMKMSSKSITSQRGILEQMSIGYGFIKILDLQNNPLRRLTIDPTYQIL